MQQQSFDIRDGKIWYNGKLQDWNDCKIHILNHGLHYGSSVYEGVRIYNYQPFKLREHLERFHTSAKILNFKIPFSVDELYQAALDVIKTNNLANGYMRPIAWRGCETMLIGAPGTTIHTAIAAWAAFETKRSEIRERGMNMCISKWRKPNPDASPYNAKAASIYTLATIVKLDAEAAGFEDAIMLDNAGNITEATTSNLFLIINNELHTPLPDCFLDGITRQTIIATAKKMGIGVHERHIKTEELKNAQAAFLTGTAIEIMPVRNIENVEYNTKHPLIEKLLNAYSNLTTLDIEE